MDTFPSLFIQQTKSRSSNPAIRYKRYGLWKTWTWADVDRAVREIACGLASKGLKPGDRVTIVGNNTPQLYFSIIAAQCLGAVPVPIHPDSKPKELIDYLNDCDARFAVVQDQQQVDALQEIQDQCEALSEIIYSDGRGMAEYPSSGLSSLDDVKNEGKKFEADHLNFFEDVIKNVTQDSDAFIIYTSGTSGKLKGAVHTQASFIGTGKALAESEKITQDEQVLAFMPLSYAANILFTYTLWMLKGFTINCPESNETIMNDLREVGPTVLYAPPHFYKALYSEIIGRSQRSATIWFDRWFALSRKNREKFLNGERLSFVDNFLWWLGDIAMYSPLKNVYGLSKLNKAFTGGDIMSGEVFNFFRSIGLHLKKTYGTTESAGLISIQGWEQLNTPAGEFIMGKPINGVDLKILDNGEIVFKGINAFKEYNDNSELTAAVKDAEGWVKTGDMGHVDTIGAVKVTERVDAVSEFSNGEEFAPHIVESALKSSPFIKEALAVGEGQDSVAAFIVIDGDSVGSWAEVNNVRFTGYRDLATKEEVHGLVKQTVDDVNEHIEQLEGHSCPPIKRFLILHREFSVDAGELTRSRKLRRDVVMEHQKALVDALYSSKQNYEIKDASTGEVVAEIKLLST